MKKERTFIIALRRFFTPAFEYKAISLKGLVPAIFGSIFSIFSIHLIKIIVNDLEKGFNEQIRSYLYWFIFLMFLNYSIMILSRHWRGAVMWPTFRKYMYNKYIDLFLHLDNNEVEKVGTGKMLTLIDKGMHAWVDLIVKFFMDILPGLVMVIFSIIFIGFINGYYAGIVSIAFLFVFFINSYLQKKAYTYRKIRTESNINIGKKFVNILMNKLEILQNNKGKQEVSKIDIMLDANILMNYKIGNYRIFTNILLKLLSDITKLGVIMLFGLGLWNNNLSFGEFISLISITYILDQILTTFVNIYDEFAKIYVEIEKLWNFFDGSHKIEGFDTGKKFKYKSGNIEIQNLTFSYTKGTKIFNKFNLEIEGEKVLALVGNSGSGKSTLAKLIAGYIHTDKGNIIVDDQKLKKISLKSYYKSIGYLTQEPSVFDGTVLDNLTYAIERELFTGELESVITMAKCEFIYDLPKGLETEIGERGVKLSGGQRQRLAIAKIFLKNPKIIILDEPTSALDSFSEEQITKAMKNLFKNRTVIVIAHRLQTVKHADRIIVLENGKIVEEGNHKDLVKEKGVYAKMLELQSGF